MLVGGTANVSPLGLTFVLVMCLAVLLVRREWAIVPIVLVSCFVTIGQRLVVAGFDVTLLRLIILVCWLRVWLRVEWKALRFNAIDALLIAWIVVKIVTGVLLWRTVGAFVNRLGQAYDAMGIYFLFRCLIRDTNDMKFLARIVAIIVVPMGAFMLFEVVTGRNLFSIFGGVPEMTIIRNGRLRAQGSFRHPILAGTFGAWAFTIIASMLYPASKTSMHTYIGMAACFAIVGSSASSGPVLALAAGIGALSCWVVLPYMKAIRWAAFGAIVAIDLVMKAPIWYLIARISYIMGGTGWHRSRLIDQAVAHIDEWWLFGTNYTAHWMPYVLETNPNMVDITNQYLGEGVSGGLATMALFILVIVRLYIVLQRETQKVSMLPEADQWLVWTIGASLTVHVVSFMSVTYFDQIIVFWYLTLASIAAIDTQARAAYRELANGQRYPISAPALGKWA